MMDLWKSVVSGVAIVGSLAMTYPVGWALVDIATRDRMTLDDVQIHGKECAVYPAQYVGEKLGSVVRAQAYADQNSGTDSVCFIGETRDGATWYSVGR